MAVRKAASWASTAPSWEVEQVFCSPLVRSIETAANVFAKADSNLCLTVTPLAREYHFELPENRGRLAAGLLSGTESGETDQAQRWPAVRQFTQRKLARLDELERPLPLRWDPAEATLTPQAAQKRWRDAIAELPLEIARSDASRIAVVCHYGVMRALCGVDAANAGLLETSMWLGDGGESQMLRRTAVQPAAARGGGERAGGGDRPEGARALWLVRVQVKCVVRSFWYTHGTLRSTQHSHTTLNRTANKHTTLTQTRVRRLLR